MPDVVAQQLCSQLTINSFACICAGPDDLLEALKDALDAAAFAQVTPVVLACSKASYHRCISTVVSSSSQPQSGGPLLSAPPGTSSSWVEPFPAKLSIEKVSAMKSTFEDSYPSEIVDSSSMPSSRLLAACNKQVQDKHYSYIAWRFRLSEEKLDEIQASRPRKIARLDDCIFDEVPSRDISDSGVSQMFLAHLLDLLAFAFCMLEVGHLASFRAYSKLFIKLAFQKPPADSGLRCPNVTEMQSADKEAWKSICDLTNKGWSMDDALHEIVQVRCILKTHLQPRVFVHKPKKPPGGSGHLLCIDRPHPKGKGGKGKGRGGKSKDRGDASGPKWMVTFYEMDSKSKCASGGIFALAVNSMIVLSFMAAQLMLVAVHVVRITRPACIRPDSARRFLRAKRLGSPGPLQVRYLRLGIRLPPQRIFVHS